jgi:hypothetical protein
LRRIIIAGTAVAALVGAAIAYGATLNTYTATISFSSTKAGTPAKPVPFSFTETIGATNADSTKVAAPLVDIKTTIYGAVSNLKDFKTCNEALILKGPKFNQNCPPGSEVATGTVNAMLGGPTLLKVPPAPAKPPFACNPDLVVYNAGGGKEWYFFTAASPTQCGGLTTGVTPPYPGTVKVSGKNLVLDVPLPSFVSTAVANHQGLYGSLIHETLKVSVLSTKVKGKTVPSQALVGCNGSKRPWSVKFTAVPAAGAAGVSSTVSGSGKC